MSKTLYVIDASWDTNVFGYGFKYVFFEDEQLSPCTKIEVPEAKFKHWMKNIDEFYNKKGRRSRMIKMNRQIARRK